MRDQHCLTFPVSGDCWTGNDAGTGTSFEDFQMAVEKWLFETVSPL
jgi:hypothetical protein